MRYTILCVLFLSVSLSAQQTDRQILEELRDRITAHLTPPEPLPPPIPTVRVELGQDAQAALESLAETGGILELADGDHGWDVRCPARLTHPVITIRGLGAAVIRGVYCPTDGGVTFEDLRIAGNPMRSSHVQLGGDRHAVTTFAQVPESFTFRRVIADGAGAVRRGMLVNARHVLIEDSEFLGYYVPGVDSQAIGGTNGTNDVTIRRSILEGASQGIIFGGGDAASEEMIPRGIVIEDSILRKQQAWASASDIKCAFELKNAIDVIFRRNTIDGVWADAWPNGVAIKVNTANQDGTNPWARVEDVLIEGNVITNVGQYVNLVGRNAGPYDSGIARRITIRNNRFLTMHTLGDGRSIVLTDGPEDVTIDHNLFAEARHSFLETSGVAGTTPIVLTNNIMRHGIYGLRNQNATPANISFNALEVRSGTQPQWNPPAGSGNLYYPAPIASLDLSMHPTGDGLPVGPGSPE